VDRRGVGAGELADRGVIAAGYRHPDPADEQQPRRDREATGQQP